jgi:hypothetical protein
MSPGAKPIGILSWIAVPLSGGSQHASRRPEEAMQALDSAISRTEEAIAEGRGAIQDSRSETSVHSDLEHLLTALGQELEGSRHATIIRRLSG